MSDDIAEAYSLLGRGFSTAARDSLDDYRKMMKEQQRYALRQQLLSAALTPIATGLSKGVTNFIAEPFRQAAKDYYNRGPGRSLQVDLATRSNANKLASKLKLEFDSKGGLDYLKELNVTKATKQLDQWGLDNLGPDFKNNPTYLSMRTRLYDAVDEQSRLDYQEVNNFYTETQKTSTGTPAETAELIKKYNPKSMGYGQKIWRGFQNFIKGETGEEALARREREFRDALEITQEQMDAIKQTREDAVSFGFTREQFEKLPFLNTPEVQKALEGYRKGLEFGVRMRNKSGSLERAMNAYEKSLPSGQNVSEQGFSSHLADEFYKQLNTSFATEKNAFVATNKTDANRRQSIIDFKKDEKLTQKETDALIGQLSGSAYDLARQWVIGDFVGNPELYKMGQAERQERIRTEISQRADYIMNNHLQVVEDPIGWWSSEDRLALNKDAIIQGYGKAVSSSPPTPIAPGQQVVTPAASSKPIDQYDQLDLNLDANSAALAVVQRNIKTALSSDNPKETYNALEQAEMVKYLKDKPNVKGVNFIYPDDVLDVINNLRQDVSTRFQRRQNQKARAALDLDGVQQFAASNRPAKRRGPPTKPTALQAERFSLLSKPGQIDDDDIVDQVSTNITAKPASDIEGIVAEVSKIFNDGRNATEMLKEIAIVESNMGQTSGTYDIAVDSKGNRGSLGVAQIDEIAFKEIQSRLKGGKGRNKYTQKTIDRVQDALGVDPTTIKYEDLADDKTNLIFARLYLMMRPDPIPKTPQDRAKYWKKYYNTVLGKGTPQKYLDRLIDYGLTI